MTGKVISFNKNKGFGFIRNDANEDYFFHYSEIIMEGFKDIDVGQAVEFDVIENKEENENKGKLRAVKIKKI